MKDEKVWELLTEVRKDVKEIRKEMSTLKLKVSSVSAFIGGIIGVLAKKLGL